MTNVSITIRDCNGEKKASICGENQTILIFQGEYNEGDTITFKTEKIDAHYVIRLDDCMDEAFVYITKPEVVYTIPFGEKKVPYNPKAFTGERHYLAMRKASDYEISSYRNIAKNVMDQHGDTGCFPHTIANVETRGEAVFAARNAIDGVLCNESHGKWPYQSWGINCQDDAKMTLDFGRSMDFDKIVLYTRADFPHDNWWVKATFTFSDGTTEVVKMEKSTKPHIFPIVKKNVTWVEISNLIKADYPSPYPALKQIEIYGKDSF